MFWAKNEFRLLRYLSKKCVYWVDRNDFAAPISFPKMPLMWWYILIEQNTMNTINKNNSSNLHTFPNSIQLSFWLFLSDIQYPMTMDLSFSVISTAMTSRLTHCYRLSRSTTHCKSRALDSRVHRHMWRWYALIRHFGPNYNNIIIFNSFTRKIRVEKQLH